MNRRDLHDIDEGLAEIAEMWRAKRLQIEKAILANEDQAGYDPDGDPTGGLYPSPLPTIRPPMFGKASQGGKKIVLEDSDCGI